MENNNNDNVFIKGLYFKKKHSNAPDFVKGSLSIKVEEFIDFINQKQKNGWVNIDLLESKGGAYYAKINTWEPNQDNANTNNTPPPQDNPPTPQSEVDVNSDEEIKVENIPF